MARMQKPIQHGNAWRIRERGSRRWVSYATEEDARQAILDDLKTGKVEAVRTRMSAGAGPTLAEYREKLLPIRRQRVSAKTLGNQDSQWRKWIKDELGGERIRRIDRDRVWEWLADMEDEGASEYVRHACLMQVSAILSAAASDPGERLARNVLHGSKREADKPVVALPHTEARSASWDEVQRLLKALPEHYVLLYRTIAETGLRITEAIDLTVGTLHLTGAAPTLTVLKGKGNKKREVPVAHELALLLADHVKGKPRTAPVFTTEDRGVQLNYANLRYNVFNPAVDRAGLSGDGDRLTMHDLRHYACTAWLNVPIAPHIVQRWMGHANVTTTLRYAHMSDSAAQLARAMVRG